MHRNKQDRKRLLLLDNYDSFTYNLFHYLDSLDYLDIDVKRNDEITLENARSYDHILLSPGPGLPENAGIMPQLIHELAPSKNILGVCLGHQAIAQSFGATLVNMKEVQHGVSSSVTTVLNDKLFIGFPESFVVGRYHSWVIDGNKLPGELEVTATDTQGNIMAIKHKTFNVRGVQFHPESIMTSNGINILKNWLF